MVTNSPKDTQIFAQELIHKLLHTSSTTPNNALILRLDGNLGTGKTSFTQGLKDYFGIISDITSPTYTIINEYDLHKNHQHYQHLYHLDLYRLQKDWELAELEFEKILKNPHNIVCIEWPKIAQKILDNYDHYQISFSVLQEDRRQIKTLHHKKTNL